MGKSKSGQIIISIVIILSTACLISSILTPIVFSLEAFMLACIAAYLGGIYTELADMNKQKRESDKRQTESEEKETTE